MNLEKPIKIKSKKLRQASKGQTCTLRQYGCKHTETVVGAHLNSVWKGVGNKSPDLFIVDACHNCHHLLDIGGVSHRDQLRALQETLIRRFKEGLISVK